MNPLHLVHSANDTAMSIRHLWLAYALVLTLQFGYAAVIFRKLCAHCKCKCGGKER